jgi:polysaccharide pyruvyl transferase WcaK-like protein
MQNDPSDSFRDSYAIALVDGGKEREFTLEASTNVEGFARFISGYSLVVSTRFHGLVFALLAGVPFINVAEYAKNTSLCKAAGLADLSLPSAGAESLKLASLTEKALSGQYGDAIQRARGMFHTSSRKMMDEFLSFIC